MPGTGLGPNPKDSLCPRGTGMTLAALFVLKSVMAGMGDDKPFCTTVDLGGK